MNDFHDRSTQLRLKLAPLTRGYWPSHVKRPFLRLALAFACAPFIVATVCALIAIGIYTLDALPAGARAPIAQNAAMVWAVLGAVALALWALAWRNQSVKGPLQLEPTIAVSCALIGPALIIASSFSSQEHARTFGQILYGEGGATYQQMLIWLYAPCLFGGGALVPMLWTLRLRNKTAYALAGAACGGGVSLISWALTGMLHPMGTITMILMCCAMFLLMRWIAGVDVRGRARR